MAEALIENLLIALWLVDKEALRAKEQLTEVLGQAEPDPAPFPLGAYTLTVDEENYLATMTVEQFNHLNQLNDVKTFLPALEDLITLVQVQAVKARELVNLGLQADPETLKRVHATACNASMGCCTPPGGGKPFVPVNQPA